MSLTAQDAATFERCMSVAGVAVFPTDTVYGLACDADEPSAVRRLYALKGRPPAKPAAVMFFDAALALAALPELGERTRALASRLLPGGVTLLLENPLGRFPLACGPDPGTLGLRVPAVDGGPLAALAAVRWPVLQSSANLAGGPDPTTLAEVPASIRREADLVLDGGPAGAVPSTVVDLRAFERAGTWRVLRQGAVPESAVAEAAGTI